MTTEVRIVYSRKNALRANRCRVGGIQVMGSQQDQEPETRSSVMTELMSVIAARKADLQAGKSYVASLMTGGIARIGSKIIEEAAEVVEAGQEAGDAGRQHLVKEVADLVFHCHGAAGISRPSLGRCRSGTRPSGRDQRTRGEGGPSGQAGRSVRAGRETDRGSGR